MQLVALFLLAWQSFSFAFYDENYCKSLTDENIRQLDDDSCAQIGPDCIRGLGELNVIHLSDFCIAELDSSAFPALGSFDMSNFSFALLEGFFKDPTNCAHITQLHTLARPFVKISEACFQEIPKEQLDTLSFDHVRALASFSSSFWSLYQQRYSDSGLKSLAFYDCKLHNYLDPCGSNSFSISEIFTDPLDNQDAFKYMALVFGDAFTNNRHLFVAGQLMKLEGSNESVVYSQTKYILRTMKGHEGFRSRLINLLDKGFTIHSIVHKLNNHAAAAFLQTLIDSMSLDDELLIPHGFGGDLEGHATSSYFKKIPGATILHYFNSGAGLEYHASRSDANGRSKFSHKVSFLIPDGELNSSFWFKWVQVLSSEGSCAMLYEGVLGSLPEEWQIKMFQPGDIFTSGQLSGNCSFKSLLTFFRFLIGDESMYHDFKLEFLVTAYHNFWNQHRAFIETELSVLSFMPLFGGVIERVGEYVVHDSSLNAERLLVLKQYLMEASILKKDSYKLLNEKQLNDDFSFNKLRVALPAANKIFDHTKNDKFVEQMEEYFKHDFIDANSDTNRDLSIDLKNKSFSFIIWTLHSVLKGQNFGNIAVTFVCDFIITDLDLDRITAAYVDETKVPRLLNFIMEIINDLTYRMTFSDNDERILTCIKLYVIMWKLYGILFPEIMNYRPRLNEKVFSAFIHPNYYSAYSEILQFLNEKTAISFHNKFRTAGTDKSSTKQFLDALFAPIKDISKISKPCGLPEDLIKANYFRSPILLLRRCVQSLEAKDPANAQFLAEYKAKYLDESFSILVEVGLIMEDFSHAKETKMVHINSNLYYISGNGFNCFTALSTRLQEKHHKYNKEYFSTVNFPNINSIIMGIEVDSNVKNGELDVKLLKTIGFLFKLDDVMKQYQAICYMACRPVIFEKESALNDLIFALLPISSDFVWDSNPNLVEAWMIMLENTFKYHDVMYCATQNSDHVLSMQRAILLGIILTMQYASSYDIIDRVSNRLFILIDAFQKIIVDFEKYHLSFLDKFILKAYLDYLRMDPLNFTANFLLSRSDVRNLQNLNRRLILDRIAQDFVGIALSEFQFDFTPELMTKTALYVNKIAKYCDLSEDFKWTFGSFPQYQTDGCFINLLTKTFSRDGQVKVKFDISNVKTGLEFFGNALESAKIEENNSTTLAGVNYFFIKVGPSNYSTCKYIGNELFFYSLPREFIRATFSPSLYNAWTNAKVVKVFRQDAETLECDYLFQVDLKKPSIQFYDEDLDYVHKEGDCILSSFFPSQAIVQGSHEEVTRFLIMNYCDNDGEALFIKQISDNLCYKDYRISINDILNAKHSIYKLPFLSILILEGNNETVALIPHMCPESVKSYSNQAVWLGFESKDPSYLANLPYPIKTSLVAVDSKGILKPSNREDTILVAMTYFIAYEYELAAYYLKLVTNTEAFSNHEVELLNWIILSQQNFPEANAIKSFAAWIWYSNNLIFPVRPTASAQNALATKNCCRMSAEFPSRCAYEFWEKGCGDEKHIVNVESRAKEAYEQYYLFSNHVRKSLRIEPTNDFEHSLLSVGEYALFKDKFFQFGVKQSSPYKWPILDPIDLSRSSEISSSFDSEVSMMMTDLITPVHKSASAVPSKFLKFLTKNWSPALKTKFCGLFKFDSVLEPLWRTFIHHACFKNTEHIIISAVENNLSIANYVPLGFYFDAASASIKTLSPIVFTDLQSSMKLEDLKAATFVEEEELFMTLYFNPKTIEFLKECQKVLNVKVEASDCSTNQDYVDKYICEGKNELTTRDNWRQGILSLLNSQSFQDFKKNALNDIAKLEEKIKQILMEIDSAYGLFNCSASTPRSFTQPNPFTDLFLISVIRSGNTLFFSNYFHATNSDEMKEMLLKIFHYFELTVQKQRLARILDFSSSAESRIDFIMEDVAERPAGAPFRKEVILLEYILNLRMRDANFKALEELLQGNILQRVMGGGKTLILGTLMLALTPKDRIGMLIPPSSLVATNAGNTQAMNFSSFAQRGHVITASRCSPIKGSFNNCINFYQYIVTILENCMQRDEYIMISRESILAFYNNYKEALLKNWPTLQLLKRIIELMKQNGFAIFDEVDSIFAPFFELNYPISDDKPMDRILGKAIIATFTLLVNNSEIKSIFNILDPSSIINPAIYDALKAALLLELQNMEEYQQCYSRSDELMEQSCQKQFKRFLDSTLEDCLSAKQNVNFGVIPEISSIKNISSVEQFAKPFLGSNTPSYGSQFSDQTIALTYTLLSYLRSDLSKSQKASYFMLLLNEAKKEFSDRLASLIKDAIVERKSDSLVAIESTMIAKVLDAQCGKSKSISYCMLGSEEECLKFLDEQCFVSARRKDHIFAYVEQMVLPSITLNEEQISSTAQDLLFLVSGYVGYSGTIYNLDAFDVTKKIATDNVALGTIMSQVIEKATRVIEFQKNSSITEIIDLVPDLKANIKAIIDSAAIFNDIDNKKIAEDCTAKLGLSGAIYFATGKDDLFFINAGAEITSLKRTDPKSLFEATRLNPSQRITIYDEIHTRGVDIVQDSNAIALVTVGLSTKLSDLLQGILRMRGFLAKQQIVFMVAKNEAMIMKKRLNMADDAVLDAKNILQWAHMVQEKQVIGENQTIFFQKLKAFLDDKAITENTLESLQALKSFHDFELVQMRSTFSEKISNFWEAKKRFWTDMSIKAYADKFKEDWKSKTDADGNLTIRNAMTKNVERVAVMDVEKQAEQVKEAEREVERERIVILTGKLGFSGNCWNFDLLFSNIDDSAIIGEEKSQPALISYSAIAASPKMDPKKALITPLYFTSNFVQVDRDGSGGANISFLLESTDIFKRRSQFGFYILLMKRQEGEGEKVSLIFMEPHEAMDYLNYVKMRNPTDQLFISSNGDILYPNDQQANLFVLFSNNLEYPSWSVQEVVKNICTACHHCGMLEIFSNLNLVDELRSLDEGQASNLLEADTELQFSLYSIMLATLKPLKEVKSSWLRHFFRLFDCVNMEFKDEAPQIDPLEEANPESSLDSSMKSSKSEDSSNQANLSHDEMVTHFNEETVTHLNEGTVKTSATNNINKIEQNVEQNSNDNSKGKNDLKTTDSPNDNSSNDKVKLSTPSDNSTQTKGGSSNANSLNCIVSLYILILLLQ